LVRKSAVWALSCSRKRALDDGGEQREDGDPGDGVAPVEQEGPAQPAIERNRQKGDEKRRE
jgi:hypothetical protein